MTVLAHPRTAVGLLLSDAVDDSHGRRFGEMAAAKGVQLWRFRLGEAPPQLGDIDAAFFSRDLYEGSSLHQPGPASREFFRIADAAPRLRWLHVCSSGLDLPQYQASIARGVQVTSSTGAMAKPIAQAVIAAVLAQSRGFGHWLAAQARRTWSPLNGAARPKELESLRVLVIGAGAIGTEIGRLARALGMHVTAVRRSAAPAPHSDATIPMTALDEALPHCDWLVLAVPLTDSTRGLLDARRIALLSAYARVANVGRGELVDEAALCEALRTGRVAGAYLDTFVEEPLPQSSPLWGLPTVWISPHNSATSQGHESRVIASFERSFEAWLENVAEGPGRS